MASLATTRQSRRRFTADREQLLDTLFVPGVVVLICVYLALTSPVFLTGANISNVLGQMVILAIAAFGETFVILAGEIDLSLGAGVAMVSVVSASVMVNMHSVALGLIAGVATGVAIGFANGLLVTVLEVPSFIETLGAAVVLRGIALALTNGGVIFGLPNSFLNVAGGSFAAIQYIVWLMAVVFVALYIVQRQTSFGIQVLAVGGNREASRLSGIPVKRVRLLALTISGITMAAAGLALMARVESGQPNGGTNLELYAIAAVVIGGTALTGGRGSLVRTVFGVLLITVLQNGLDLRSVDYSVQQAIIGGVFIAAASVDFARRTLARRSARRADAAITAAAEAPAPAEAAVGTDAGRLPEY